MVTRATVALAALVSVSMPALAQDEEVALDPALPVPTLELERLPPTTSYELAVHMSYGTVTYWRDFVPTWIGFGVRGGWGRNMGVHRIGVDGTLIAEGPLGVHMTLGFEPALSYNMVSADGLLLGAGVGPAFLYHASAAESPYVTGESSFGIAPSAAARIGWSQTWTRVGRRLFVFVEPKMRYVAGAPNPLIALAVGSGLGS